MAGGATIEVLARTSVGTGGSYEMNTISGYRILVFIFEELSSSSTGTISFQVGVAGPTFRTSGYVGYASTAGSQTANAGLASTTNAAHIAKSWVIEVFNADDSGEKTHYNSICYLDIATDRVETQVGRYDTAEANVCFRLLLSTGVFDGGFVTILGEP